MHRSFIWYNVYTNIRMSFRFVTNHAFDIRTEGSLIARPRLRGNKTIDVTYHAEEYIGGSVERFSSCRSHGKLHQPGYFSDDVLYNSPVEQNGHY